MSQSAEAETKYREQLDVEMSRREEIERKAMQSCEGYLQELEVLRVMAKDQAREEALADSQAARYELETLRRRLTELGDAILSKWIFSLFVFREDMLCSCSYF